jgi:hypothetical protein
VSDTIVHLEALIRGYTEALGRFHEAKLGRDPVAAFLPLFEALNWAASIDERLEYPEHPELRGLRFARNRVHHQWAEALRLTEDGELPATLPMVFFEWRWRDRLPHGERGAREESTYAKHLAGRPARRTLDAVAEFFAGL